MCSKCNRYFNSRQWLTKYVLPECSTIYKLGPWHICAKYLTLFIDNPKNMTSSTLWIWLNQEKINKSVCICFYMYVYVTPNQLL